MMLVTEFILQDPNTVPSKMVREIFIWVPTSKSLSPLLRLNSWKLCHLKMVWVAHVWCYTSHTSLCVIPTAATGLMKNIASLYKPPLCRSFYNATTTTSQLFLSDSKTFSCGHLQECHHIKLSSAKHP